MNLRSTLTRFRNSFRKRSVSDRDLDAELHLHLQLHIQDNLARGMRPDEARRQALLKLGGLEQTKESERSQRTLPFFEAVLQDTRYAARLLRKSPAFSAIAILTLALGIGANTAIFSVVNSVLLRSLPFSHPSSLVYLSTRSTLFDFPYLGFSFVDLEEVRKTSSSFSGIAMSQDSPKEIISEGKPQRVEASEVTEDFFPVLGLRPLHGRLFTSADMQPGSRSAILSYELWRNNFGASPSAIVKTITLDAVPHTIVGVMPPLPVIGFSTDSKLWTAFVPTPEQLADRGNHNYPVVARLKPHVSLARVQADSTPSPPVSPLPFWTPIKVGASTPPP